MYRLCIEVDIQKTDPNKLLGCSPRLKHRLFSKIKSDIAKICQGRGPEKPLEKFKITVIRHGVKFLDWDNLVASLKPSIDGLTLAGIIKDDSWNFIRHIEVDQVKSKEKKLIINVVEI
jgi:Holliday junction resolvase RusA-like endonuclease